MRYTNFKKIVFRIPLCKNFFLLTLVLILLAPWFSYADENSNDTTLIIYYSRTGKSALVSETLQEQIGCDIIEIQDVKERAGLWGFIGAAIDSFYDKHTEIEPEQPDLASYTTIIIVTPVWNWKLSVPIRTLMHTNSFEGKKVIACTTANIDIKKYAHYGDDAPAIKRFLRDYLNIKRKEMINLVKNSGAEITGHYHIPTQDRTDQEIKTDALQFINYMKQRALF